MDIFPLGLRDIILLLVAVAAVYLVVVLVRLIQVGRRRQSRPPPEEPLAVGQEPAAEGETLASYAQSLSAERFSALEPAMTSSRAVSAYEELAAAEPFAAPPTPTFEWEEVKELFRENPEREAPAAPASPAATGAVSGGSGFGEHLADHLARTDVEMEMQRMRDEMQRMRGELEALRATRNVSPHYAEAMELVQRGKTAQEVADYLGISMAEAELVQALSRGRQNFD